MDDSSPPTPELPEGKNRLPSNSGIKRNKVSRACDECRKRKVRCDGAQPCARCQRSSTECIFSNVTPKRGPPKQYLEPFEARLKTIDTVLQALESSSFKVEQEHKFAREIKDSIIETNTHLDVSTIGQALYIPDYPARQDRIEPIHEKYLNSEPPQPILNTTETPIRLDLIKSYFDNIHPSIPFLHRSTLVQPHSSSLLLNAIYAVASKFVSQPQQQKSTDPPGWSFYKIAVSLIDTYAEVPRLSTVQAFLLLVKYHEHIYRPGFFWRTKFFLQLAVKMSGDLGLSKEPPHGTQPYSGDHELEIRRRTFWAVYAYEILMSTEHGLQSQFQSKECTVNYPHVLSDESGGDANAVLNFYWLLKVIQTQAAVIEFMRIKFASDKAPVQDEAKQLDEINHTFSELQERIPHINEGSIHTSAIHLIYHMAVILLNRPYAVTDDPVLMEQHEIYTSRCLSSASSITRIVDDILSRDGLDSLCAIIRGYQQVVYCLTAAITILRVIRKNHQKHLLNYTNDLYEKTHSLINVLITNSPVTELDATMTDNYPCSDRQIISPSNTSSTRSSPLIPALNSPHSPSIPAPTIRKRHSRSSLQFPTTDMSYGMQPSGVYNAEITSHRMRPSAGRSPYASNRLSAPALGSLYQQSPYFHQMQLQQQQQQQQHYQMQQQQQQHQQQQQQQQHQHISSYSQPSSPTASQFGGSEYSNNASGMPPVFPVTPRRTTSLSRKTGLRRSASSTGEFIVPSQRANRTSARPYMNPRRHTLTNATPPDLTNVIAAASPSSTPSVIDSPTSSTSRNLHAMAVRNNRFSAPVMSNNTQNPYMIPITTQQQQQHQQQHSMMLDPLTFPMDPVIPDSPNESMMGLLLNPWDFSSQQPQ